MKIYPLVREILFFFDPEFSHNLTLKTLRICDQLGFLRLLLSKIPIKSTSVMGLQFPNIIGLAAGVDKNADYVDCMSKYGFGHIEVGTVTPEPQPGNSKPRLFRILPAQGIINRMGFNNKGVDYMVNNLKKLKYSGILGINIGKNATTTLEKAVNDYLICLNKVYPYASYISVNISSPNTPGLRDMQHGDFLQHLLKQLKDRQIELANQHNKYVPLVVKVAPDLSSDEIKFMSQCFLEHNIDGIIATNTTVSRNNVEGLKHAQEKGGLSGRPLFDKALAAQKQFYFYLQDKIPIIASGGVVTPDQAAEKLKHGAKLIQLYTGISYTGPSLLHDIAKL